MTNHPKTASEVATEVLVAIQRHDSVHDRHEAVAALISSDRREREKELRELLDEAEFCLVQHHEDSPCRRDHHGYCQEHYWFEEGECLNVRIAKLLKAIAELPPLPGPADAKEERE